MSAAAVDATLARLNLTQLPAVAVFSRAGQTVTTLEAAPSLGDNVKAALESQIREYIGDDTTETSTRNVSLDIGCQRMVSQNFKPSVYSDPVRKK